MRWRPWMTAVAGLATGALIVAALPERALFRPPESKAGASAAVAGERWACPMMDFIGDKPGRCPVCGMTLQRVAAGDFSPVQQARMGLETATATSGIAQVTVRAYGAAEYDHRFSRVVIPRVGGRIVGRHAATFGNGHSLEAGAPIVDLYSPDLIGAQAELAAAVRLGDDGLITSLRQRFERWNLADVAGRVAQGGAVEDIVTVRSPFSGQVLLQDFDEVNDALEVGREIMPDTPLLRLVDPDRLVLVIHVPETRANFLAEGQPVEIASDDRGALPGLHAVVGRVAPEIDPEIRAREVRVYLDHARGRLQPGSLVSAQIRATLGPDLAPADPVRPETWGRFVLVPKSAVLSTGVRNVAWRLAAREPDGHQRFALAPLTLGPRLEDDSGNDQYVVLAGLNAGDEVATQGAFLIDSQAQLAGTPSLLTTTVAAPAPAGHVH